MNLNLYWKQCVVKNKKSKIGTLGLAKRKIFKVPEKPLLELKMKIGVFIGLFLFAVV